MTSTSDGIAVQPRTGESDTIAQAAAPPAATARQTISLPATIGRELRLDLFRGLALWLIFIDHVSPDLLSWFTIRSYGFSDAAEIFIFISGYTAAFVYGRAMLESGMLIATARILRRVYQIYAAHILLFAVLVGAVSYVAIGLEKGFYAEEMEIAYFLKQPGVAMAEAVLLMYRPLNMDVLPLYIVLMLSLPLVLRLMKWGPDWTLAASAALYVLAHRYDLHLTAHPRGFWSFNPFAWQLLFVFGAWCALGGGRRISSLLSSRLLFWIAVTYVVAAFCITMTWYIPQLDHILPAWLERWIYPIDKTDLDILRFAHFVALAVIVLRFSPPDWPWLKSPWLWPMILCGQHSLEIFSLGVALAFAGYYLLTEMSAGLLVHVIVGVCGITIMSAVAWLLSWYKLSVNKAGPRSKRPGKVGTISGTP